MAGRVVRRVCGVAVLSVLCVHEICGVWVRGRVVSMPGCSACAVPQVFGVNLCVHVMGGAFCECSDWAAWKGGGCGSVCACAPQFGLASACARAPLS